MKPAIIFSVPSTTSPDSLSLSRARASREQWVAAYQQAVEDGHREADFAAKQVAMFDRMIERFERLAALRPTQP